MAKTLVKYYCFSRGGGGKRATPFVVDLNKSKRNQKENEEEVNK